MPSLAGTDVAFLGRLERLPRRRAVREVEIRGGRVVARPTRPGDLLVIGAGARGRLFSGTLDGDVDRARRHGVGVLSEGGFLCRLGLCRVPAATRSITLAELSRQSGLPEALLDHLALFDVISPAEGRYGFRDLVAARDVARLLGEGAELCDIIAAVAALERHRPDGPHLAAARLVRSADGRLAVRFGETTTDFAGQLALPLPEPAEPTTEALLETAEAAEAVGDLEAAASLYSRSLRRDPGNAVILFNLANVRREQGERQDAEILLRRALAGAPAFAEAWYNLADLLLRRGDHAAARDALRQAVAADGSFADAVFNLAQAEFRDGHHAEAAELWERYLRFDDSSEWARKARHGIALCRLADGAAEGR